MEEKRSVLSVDMTRMHKLLNVDEVNLTCELQAGANGRQVEEMLNARGFTMVSQPPQLDRQPTPFTANQRHNLTANQRHLPLTSPASRPARTACLERWRDASPPKQAAWIRTGARGGTQTAAA